METKTKNILSFKKKYYQKKSFFKKQNNKLGSSVANINKIRIYIKVILRLFVYVITLY
jgi:hypothetical protein